MTEVCIARPGFEIDALRAHYTDGNRDGTAPRPTCWYFGDDYERLAAIRRHCADTLDFAAVGEAINRVARRIEDEFIDLDRQLVRGRLSRLLWDASALGERNPHQSELLVNACRYHVFLEAIATPGRHLFVVEEGAFARLLFRVARDCGSEVGWLPGSTVRTPSVGRRLHGLLASLVERARDLRTRWRRLRCHRTFRGRSPLPCERLLHIDVLLVTWAGPRSFARIAGERGDEYWGRLPSMLAGHGLRVAHLAKPLDWIYPYEEILDGATHATEPVLFIDDCVGSFDRIIAALLPALFARVCGSRVELGGTDLSRVLALEIAKEVGKGHIRSSLRLGAVGRWLARKGVRPRLILYPYEGQSWEKMLRRGVRRHLPATRLGGCQHAPFASGYLSFFPSRDDIASGRIPDGLGVIGGWYGRCFGARGFPADRIAVLGSLRMEHLATTRKSVAALSPSPAGPTVLCCCSIGFAESAELVVKTASAVADEPDLRLVVNFHPVTSRRFRDQIRRCVEEASSIPQPRVTYSGRSVRELVAEADVLVYNSSGAAFDALARGVPVVFVGCDTTLDLNKVPDHFCRRARSVGELRLVLRSISEERTSGQQEVVPELGDCFAEPRLHPLLDVLEASPPRANPGGHR